MFRTISIMLSRIFFFTPTLKETYSGVSHSEKYFFNRISCEKEDLPALTDFLNNLNISNKSQISEIMTVYILTTLDGRFYGAFKTLKALSIYCGRSISYIKSSLKHSEGYSFIDTDVDSSHVVVKAHYIK